MQLEPITSSMMRGYHYDEEKKVLHIQFHDGALYRYDRVPKATVEEMVNHESPGGYFHRSVKNHYPTTLVPHE